MPRDTATEIHEATKVMQSSLKPLLSVFQSLTRELREVRISMDKLTKQLEPLNEVRQLDPQYKMNTLLGEATKEG